MTDILFEDLDDRITESDSGFSARAGLRVAPLPALELEGGVNYIHFDDVGEAGYFDAAARLYVTSFLALQLSAEIADADNYLYMLGLRAELPYGGDD